jgi:L-iditol 2-dehydrogenase
VKAAALMEPYVIKLVEKELPKIGPGEILVEVKSASICATDVARYTGKRSTMYPSYMGHEFSGDVIQVGSDVNLTVKEGDRISCSPVVACGKCKYCRRGLQQLCTLKKTIGVTPGIDGALSQYIKIPRETVCIGGVVKLPESVSYDEAALIEPYSTVLNNLLNSELTLGKTVLIIGCGPMGLMHVQLARLMGASKIIATDLLKERLELAKEFGADVTVDPKEVDTIKRIQQLTDGQGTDIAVATVASQVTIENAVKSVGRKGVVSIFGGATKNTFFNLDPNAIHYGEVKLIGSFSAPIDVYHKAFEIIADKKIDAIKLITHHFTLAKIEEAFKIAATPKALKVMVHPNN